MRTDERYKRVHKYKSFASRHAARFQICTTNSTMELTLLLYFPVQCNSHSVKCLIYMYNYRCDLLCMYGHTDVCILYSCFYPFGVSRKEKKLTKPRFLMVFSIVYTAVLILPILLVFFFWYSLEIVSTTIIWSGIFRKFSTYSCKEHQLGDV